MPCNNSLKFKGISQYGDPTLMEELEINLKHWMDWSFLCIGAWQDIDATSSGIYGGSFEELLPKSDAGYSSNQEFFSIRKDWIYETGINYCSPAQDIASVAAGNNEMIVTLKSYERSSFIQNDKVNIATASLTGEFSVVGTTSDSVFEISSTDDVNENGGEIYGIYNPTVPKIFVDGVETGSGFNIDYPRGRVVFDSPLSTANKVTASYSFRNVQTYISSDVPWNYEVQNASLDPANISWSNSAESGEFSSAPGRRVQLPAVIIEAVAKRSSTGYQLGSGALKTNQDVLMTVVSENKYERNIITDILASQKHINIPLYDIDVVNKHGKMPLTFEGYLSGTGASYKEIALDSEFLWANAFISDVNVSEVSTNSPDFHMSKVRFTVEVVK